MAASARFSINTAFLDNLMLDHMGVKHVVTFQQASISLVAACSCGCVLEWPMHSPERAPLALERGKCDSERGKRDSRKRAKQGGINTARG